MNFPRHRRFLATSIAVALATFCAAPSAPVFAQGPGQAPPAPTSADAKAFENINSLAEQGKWPEAVKAAEKFRDQYKDLSPYSRNNRYILALAYLHQEKAQDDALRELNVLKNDPKALPALKEQVMLLIAKAHALKGAGLPDGTEPQRKMRDGIFDEAVKAYDAYITAYPASRSNDSAYFVSGTLLMQMKRYDDARKRFQTVTTDRRFANSPFRPDAVLNIGKSYLMEGSDLLSPAGGKEPTPEDIQKAMAMYDKDALGSLVNVFRATNDLAIQNEAQFYVGTIRLTQSQHISETDEEKKKKQQNEYLTSALEAFRAVRSLEEVMAAQDAKIKALQDAIQRLPAGTPDYLPNKNYYENLIGNEQEKKDTMKNGVDQYLAARVNIAKIFHFLGKPDESRVLVRYLQGQQELLAKDKEAQAAVAALLSHTYIDQNNADKAIETLDAFRQTFRGHEAGEDVPLFVANLIVEKKPDKAEEIVNQAIDDYKAANNGAGWQFTADAQQILIHVALGKGDYKKALDLCDKVLGNNPKPEVESDLLLTKGAVQASMAMSTHQPALQDEALRTFQTVRDKFPNTAKAEDAQFRQVQIQAGKAEAGDLAPEKALTDLEAFTKAFENGNTKSEHAKENLAIATYQTGKVLNLARRQDDAIKAYRKLIDTYGEADSAADAFFRIFDIETERKNFAGAKKAMEDFLAKYPDHKNVHFAYNNIAEILFSGALKPKNGPDGKPLSTAQQTAATLGDLDAGTKKLYEFVDLELEKKFQPPHGEGALIKVMDRWIKQAGSFGNFAMLTKDQKHDWQHCVDEATKAVDKHLKSYPDGDRVAEALEKAVALQKEKLKTQQIDAAGGETYFNKLDSEYGGTKEMKAKIQMALASFLQDSNLSKAKEIRLKATLLMGESTSGKPSFSPNDWDQVVADAFEDKKYDAVGKIIERIRKEYPDGGPRQVTDDAQAVALFWEGKVMEAQGKVADAGKIFEKLRDKYPHSTKLMEADYGIINGKMTSNNLTADKDRRDAINRLTQIFGVTNSKKFDLQARALYLTGQIYEQMQDYDNAIASYSKISARFGSVSKVAADGLWKAAEIAEKQSNGTFKVRTKAELQEIANKLAAEKKAAEKTKADAEKPAGEAAKPGETAKPGDKKPDAKPGDKKPADGKTPPKPGPKPADKTTAANDPKK